MPVTPEQLKQVPLLAGLDKKSLARVAAQMRDRHVSAGSDVVVQGESGVGFFVILDGEATVAVDGKERRTLGAGDYFGEIALLNQEAIRSATVTARTDLHLAGLTSWQFRPLVHEEPDIAVQLMETLAHRMGH
jgi:CRP/FNR family transcriptional regulator, cyclic AMP receptor protein